ncbi:unnamed protein product [Gordionus sp. m RMFG-2023]
MNLHNVSFDLLNWTRDDFNQSEMAEMAVSSFTKFYLKYGILFLSLHGMLGNTLSFACLTKLKMNNSEPIFG